MDRLEEDWRRVRSIRYLWLIASHRKDLVAPICRLVFSLPFSGRTYHVMSCVDASIVSSSLGAHMACGSPFVGVRSSIFLILHFYYAQSSLLWRFCSDAFACLGKHTRWLRVLFMLFRFAPVALILLMIDRLMLPCRIAAKFVAHGFR